MFCAAGTFRRDTINFYAVSVCKWVQTARREMRLRMDPFTLHSSTCSLKKMPMWRQFQCRPRGQARGWTPQLEPISIKRCLYWSPRIANSYNYLKLWRSMSYKYKLSALCPAPIMKCDLYRLQNSIIMAPQRPSNYSQTSHVKKPSQVNHYQDRRFLEQLEKILATKYSSTGEPPTTTEPGYSQTNPKRDN